MNWVSTCVSFCILTVAVHCGETNLPRSINAKSNNGVKPVVRRMWNFEQPQMQAKLSDSPIFRSLNKASDVPEQHAESFGFHPASYSPLPTSMSPQFARNYGYYPMNQDPSSLYMDYVVDHWMREAQRKQIEQQQQRANGVALSQGGINGAIYIPALANGAFGGPITVLNPQGQPSQEELIDAVTTVGGSNSVESSQTGGSPAECRSNLKDYDQSPYYSPQFRSSFYSPNSPMYYDEMGYSSPTLYPGQFDYLGYPYFN